MRLKITWHPQAIKVLKRLPKHIIERVFNKLDDVSKEPFRFLEHYEGERLFKLRIGDYRALIDLFLEDNLLKVKVFNHRSKIYKR